MRHLKTFLFSSVFVFACAAFLFPLSYQMGESFMSGGVTLFDESSPLMGLNNPNSVMGFNELKPDYALALASGDLNKLKTRYGFGRLSLPSVFAVAMLSEEAVGASDYYIPLIQSFNLFSDLDAATLQTITTIGNILTFGQIDMEALLQPSTNTNTMDIMENLVEAISHYDSPGTYTFFNANLLSYYHNNWGFAFYAGGEASVGLYGEDRNLLVAPDPVANIHAEVGLGITFGVGEYDLPLVGDMEIAGTLRLSAKAVGEAESVDDILVLLDEVDYAQNYFATNQVEVTANNVIGEAFAYLQAYSGMFASAFENSQYIKAGYGIGLDVGLQKELNDQVILALQVKDLISPVFWVNQDGMGWVAPEVIGGLSYDFELKNGDTFWMSDPTLLVQIDDLIYTKQKAFLSKLHVAISSDFLGDFVRLGAGLNAGYPTMGMTIHLSPYQLTQMENWGRYVALGLAPLTCWHIEITASLYGEELGSYPGDFGFQGYAVGAEIYYGF